MAKVRPAAHWQRRDDPVRRIADAGHPVLKADMLAVLRKLPDLVPDDVIRYAQAGDWHGFVRNLDWNHFRQVMRGPFGRIGKIREAAAQLGAGQINASHARAGRPVRFRKSIRKDAGDQFAFDSFAEDIQAQLRAAQDQLIAELEEGVRDTIEQVVMNGVRMGLGPQETMDDIRQVIGLTSTQAQAVLNYRDMLESLDSGVLDRRLRNFLEDDTVQAALDAGTPLDEAVIDKLTQDYTDNYLDYRAETIAQTESTRAANYGLQDSYEQAIDRGVFPASAVRQHWRIDLGENTCKICKSIPDLNPDGVPMGEPFDSIAGPVDAPPDPHPGCLCSIAVVTDLDQVDTGDTEAA